MWYAIAGLVALSGLFLWLFIRKVGEVNRLKIENKGLIRDIASKTRQLELAANHPDTPATLAERMRNGTL